MRVLSVSLISSTALLAWVPVDSAAACTAFLLERGDQRAVAKEYDYSIGQGLVMSNAIGVMKQALPMKPGDQPARWVSKHASLTFNQYGRELPNGGMNDAGLVAEVLWWEASAFPELDQRPSLNELQLVQYLLDNFDSVPEAVKGAQQVRVSRVHGAVHYFLCDKGGACAALEFVGGKLSVTTDRQMVAKVLTNHGYAESARFLARHRGFGGKQQLPAGPGSLARFVRASGRVAGPAPLGLELHREALGILDSVKLDTMKWQIVYLPGQSRVYFRSAGSPKLKWVDPGHFPSTCSVPPRVLDINADMEGDVSARFLEYSVDANQRLVESSLGALKGKLPPGAVQAVARYPAQLPCGAAKAVAAPH